MPCIPRKRRVTRPPRATPLLAALLSLACVGPSRSYYEQRDAWDARAGAFAEAADGAATEAPAAPPALGPDAGLDELLARALHVSPSLRGAAQQWKAALERVPQVGALPDPQVTFTYYLEEVQSRDGPLEWRVGLMQPLPWFGELDLADGAALAEARAAGARFEQARLDLQALVRNTWAELAYIDAAITSTRGVRELLLRWEGVARKRYATGLGDEADVIRAQVELGQLDDRLRSLIDLRRPVGARLNAALDRPVDTVIASPGFGAASSQTLDEEALRVQLPSTAPTLSALDHEVAAAEARVQLADTGFYPRPSVGVDYTSVGKGGDDAIGLTAGLSIPIWRGRIRAGVASAEATSIAKRAQRHEAGNRAAAELETLLFTLRDAGRREDLYRDTLVPKGHESLAVVDVSYRAGQTDFLSLIDAQRVLLEFELAVARARADIDQARAAVAALTGVDLHAPNTELSR